ncbi:transcriptional adapter 1-like [Watersipora subatra]|uniref:transcriptional adapter 1-like n=1 Tax=Watersipora subatra TaxID=2589382 RepID=UPI00355BC39E
MSSDKKLNEARQKVQAVLNDQMKVYLSLMGAWFRGKMTKEEFDSQARSLFTDNSVRVHNEFLLAMLNRVQATSSSPVMQEVSRPSTLPIQAQQKPKLPKKKPFVKANFSQRFQPGNQLKQVRPMTSPPPATAKPVFVSSSHGLLPDPGMIEGRLFVTAWELELEHVQSQIYALISFATENLLKDIISHVLSCRYGYRISKTAKIKQYIGVDMPLVYLSESNPKESGLDSIESAQREEAQAVQSLAKAGHVTTHREPITPHDMFTALQSNPDVIGSYSAYTLAMERLSARLYHPESLSHSHRPLYSRKRRLLSLNLSPV